MGGCYNDNLMRIDEKNERVLNINGGSYEFLKRRFDGRFYFVSFGKVEKFFDAGVNCEGLFIFGSNSVCCRLGYGGRSN